MGLDDDLSETLGIAHDLGHPPFGHTGEDVLVACMEGYQGFDYNAQTLRVLTKLERKYPLFDGLNLTWETLEGVVKHNGPLVRYGQKLEDLPVAIQEYNATHDLALTPGQAWKRKSPRMPMMSPTTITISTMVCALACFR